MAGRFTDEVKQELARAPRPSARLARAELAALLRFGGALTLSGGEVRRTTDRPRDASGATARRTFTLLQHTLRGPPGAARPRAGRRADAAALRRPRRPGRWTGRARSRSARRRGPTTRGEPDRRRPPCRWGHRAGRVPRRWQHLLARPRAAPRGRRPPPGRGGGARGVHPAAGRRHRHRVGDRRRASTGRRQVRGRHRRAARGARGVDARSCAGTNAASAASSAARRRASPTPTQANLRRSVDAAATQVAAVERVIAAIGWDELDDDLRGVALARLASPEASIAELGQLTDPPSSRSYVHRRLKRLEKLATEVGTRPPGGEST